MKYALVYYNYILYDVVLLEVARFLSLGGVVIHVFRSCELYTIHEVGSWRGARGYRDGIYCNSTVGLIRAGSTTDSTLVKAEGKVEKAGGRKAVGGDD